ncbi:hypothetical protein PAT3040_06369, partial [Paenibacillus agaridevorans]
PDQRALTELRAQPDQRALTELQVRREQLALTGLQVRREQQALTELQVRSVQPVQPVRLDLPEPTVLPVQLVLRALMEQQAPRVQALSFLSLPACLLCWHLR